MRYKPERALTPSYTSFNSPVIAIVEMRYKPERALTRYLESRVQWAHCAIVEMRYKPERALTLSHYLRDDSK